MDFPKALIRRVGRAIQDYNMIRGGDRIAVGVSGGKDSLALLDALLQLQKKSPVAYRLQAFTVEQGKFDRPIEPLGDHMKARGVEWIYYRDEPSFKLIEEQPDHGCDLCSRYRRRAAYEIASELGCNVVALGHTQDDFCEALLRNTLYTGRLSALPAVTYSRSKDFRLIRPLVYVSEEITSGYAEHKGIPLTPCVCSYKPGFPFWPSWSVYDSRLPAAMQRFSHCCQVRYSFRCRSGLRMLADHGVPAKPEGPLATPLPRRPSATRVRWLFRAVDVTLRAQVAPKSAAACRRTTSGSDAPPQAATNNIARASRAVRPSSSADAASSSATSF